MASDAVTSLVSADTYAKMNTTFSNQYANKQCGGKASSRSKCPTCGGSYRKKKSKTGKSKSGGGLMDSINQGLNSAQQALGVKSHFLESPFTSSPAPALNAVLPRNVGVKDQFVNPVANAATKMVNAAHGNAGKAKFVNAPKAPPTVSPDGKLGGARRSKSRKQSGGNMKSMGEMMTQNAGTSYQLYNKKGGATDGFGLNYDAIKSQGSTNGNQVDRSVASGFIPNQILANESYTGMPPINKVTTFGSPSDTTLPFSYSSERATVAPPASGGASKERLRSLLKKAKALAAKKSKSSSSSKKTKKV